MHPLPPPILHRLESFLKIPIQEVERLSGGSINEAYLLKTSKGNFFIKYNKGDFAKPLFEKEVLGLEILTKSGGIKTPQILLQRETETFAFLLMEFIEPGNRDTTFWEKFGNDLAQLHRQSTTQFGLNHSNYIGRLPQSNTYSNSWIEFYKTQRIDPQVKMAIEGQHMNISIAKSFEVLFKKANDLFPKEPPALVHGDLWSGNFLADEQNNLVLIDPAVCYAHREMDIAMTHLFGGFSNHFYNAYQESYPLQPGFKNRIDLYQLYYLLVHVNLFGGSYVNQVVNILNRFA